MRILIIALLLTGCSSTPIEVKQTEFFFKLNLVDEPIIHEGKQRSGLAKYMPGYCEVTIPKDELTNCLLHEVLHCIGGKWHGDTDNYEYCGR